MATAILTAATSSAKLLIGDKEPSIDNWIFRLYYRWSSALLILGSITVSSNQFFGEPIQCDLPGGGVSEGTLKTYCWMYSTFNIPPSFQVSFISTFYVYSLCVLCTVYSYQGNCYKREHDGNTLYNSYYQVG